MPFLMLLWPYLKDILAGTLTGMEIATMHGVLIMTKRGKQLLDRLCINSSTPIHTNAAGVIPTFLSLLGKGSSTALRPTCSAPCNCYSSASRSQIRGVSQLDHVRFMLRR